MINNGKHTVSDSQIVQVYDDWYLSKDKNVCYISSYPLSSSGNYLDRGSNYIMIAYNNSTHELEISTTAGIPYKDNEYTKLGINSTYYYLINKNNKAWVVNNENSIIQKLKKNSPNDIVVFNKFINNQDAIDKYTTHGFLNALMALNTVCTDYLSVELDLDNDFKNIIIHKAKKYK